MFIVLGASVNFVESVVSTMKTTTTTTTATTTTRPSSRAELEVGADPAASSRVPATAAKSETSVTDGGAPEPSGQPSRARGSGSAPKAPAGPVISVAEARKKLEPKVLACMRRSRTHALRAYMGNKGPGPVSVLSDSRTRVDGARTKLAGTALGRCMNDAGKSVRTRASKSNYVRFDLRNNAVRNPLGRLPKKSDRKAVAAVVAAVDDKVRACARKHGQEGLREVFYFKIDGPAGEVLSVRGTYLSKKFRGCAEAHYRKLSFPKVQESDVKYTHDLRV